LLFPQAIGGREDQWKEIVGTRGTEVALVGASAKPLTEADLNELEEYPLVWSGQIRRLAAAVPISPNIEQRSGTRGLGAQVTSARAGLTQDFQQQLSTKFNNQYHGWAIRHD
jgi:hypothetical protein